MGQLAVQCLQDFLSLSSGLARPSDITILLKYLCNIGQADGIIYWQLAPGSLLTNDERRGRFFPIASWSVFDDVRPWYSLPVESVTGEAWLNREPEPFKLIPSIERDKTVPDSARKSLMRLWNMDSCASIPVDGLNGGTPTCVTFYRRNKAIELKALESTVPLVHQLPMLHALAADRQSLNFLTKLSETLRPAGDPTGIPDRPSVLVSARLRLKAVCDLIANHFEGVEVSILLAEETTGNDVFKVQASYWT